MIANTFVAIPPRNEQNRIIDKLSSCYSELNKYNKVELELYSLNSTYKEQLKKSILQYAIEGKLVVQDSNDESVDILLDKIREEKNKLIAEGKIKKDKNESFIFKRDNSYYENINGKEICIDDELPFEVPCSWTWARLDSIGQWGSGATPSKSNPDYYNKGTIPWLLTGDLNNSIINEVPNKITEFALEKTSVKLNPIGSVLIAMYGATIGKLIIRS